jgi:hypothetical protein
MTGILWHLPSLLTHEAWHFAWQFIAAYAVCLLTLTTSSRVTQYYFGAVWQTRLKWLILALALALGLLAAGWAHAQLDSFSAWWAAPLGEPMTILPGNEVR